LSCRAGNLLPSVESCRGCNLNEGKKEERIDSYRRGHCGGGRKRDKELWTEWAIEPSRWRVGGSNYGVVERVETETYLGNGDTASELERDCAGGTTEEKRNKRRGKKKRKEIRFPGSDVGQ